MDRSSKIKTYQDEMKVTYENFPLWSSLYLKEFMPHFSSLYNFCRTVDNYGDLHPDIGTEKLDSIEYEIDNWSKGSFSQESEFYVLTETIEQFELPITEFKKLVCANRQDLRQRRYSTFQDLLKYCRLSANPVGRLVLKILGYNLTKLNEYSDKICTGLQITNFLQDVKRDSQLGRIYIPLEDLKKFSVSEKQILQSRCSDGYRNLIQFEVERCWEMFNKGIPLIQNLKGTQQIPIALFIKSGRKILNQIKKVEFDTLNHRPTISKTVKATLVIKTIIDYLVKDQLLPIKQYDT